jgi:Na+-transporting NADH:ubiquinone oxidoreductase subunit C
MSTESTKKTIIVVLGVCIICSILVSSAAVSLRPRQENNKKLEKLKNILIAGDLFEEKQNLQDTFSQKIKSQMIELQTGKPVSEDMFNDVLNLENFDIKTISTDSRYSRELEPAKDLGKIKRMPKYMTIYEVVENEQIEKYIFPIYGKGLWSTLYGFMALDKDLRTIKGFTFYEHGETPGLGGEVDNPSWKAQWKGKSAFDDNWNIIIEVIKGRVDQTSQEAKHQIDGLSGSTLTTRGVDQLVKFWLGDEGYGTFLKRLREENV